MPVQCTPDITSTQVHTIDTPWLTREGKIWGVFCEFRSKFYVCNFWATISIMLYWTVIHQEWIVLGSFSQIPAASITSILEIIDGGKPRQHCGIYANTCLYLGGLLIGYSVNRYAWYFIIINTARHSTCLCIGSSWWRPRPGGGFTKVAELLKLFFFYI